MLKIDQEVEMSRESRIGSLAMLGIGGIVVALAVGVHPVYLAVLLACPLMMVLMMRSMSGMGNMGAQDRTVQGCEHNRGRVGGQAKNPAQEEGSAQNGAH